MGRPLFCRKDVSVLCCTLYICVRVDLYDTSASPVPSSFLHYAQREEKVIIALIRVVYAG